jgi:starch synthase
MNFIKSSKKLKILFVGSEAAPFVKVGGLGEVLHALPKALNEIGHDARVFIPKFGIIDQEKFAMDSVVDQLLVPDPDLENIICNVKSYTSDEGAITYFLENEEYYEKRGSVYGYDDDAARWALLARGAIEFARHSEGWKPDIIVGNDWQGGLIPNYMKCRYKDDPVISTIASVFIIHNIHYQGTFDYRHISELDYDDGQSEIPSIADPRLLKLNFVRRGIRYADVINTVSPNYAREITTPEYGEMLDTLLQERRSRLFGILNGINYDAYNPETNPYVEYKYNIKNVSERLKNKKILQQKFNLPEKEDAFVVAMVGRLAEQKGFDLVIEVIEPLLKNFDFQIIILGSGDSKYLAFFEELDKRYKNVATHLSYDGILPHVIYAGADSILIPSRFEPSGLTQMEAMRYGVVPIVRHVGGLVDSVEDVDLKNNTGTGFVFEAYDHYALFGAFVRAFETYHYPKIWSEIQKRAMKADFSWEKSAKEYVKLFERALNQFNK